ADIAAWCGGGVPVARAMPNRPALNSAGATAIHAPPGLSAAHRALAEQVLGAVGTTVWVADEDALDVVTALSGSGPAYFFLLAELMTDAAVTLGLERDSARELAIQTLFGSGRMARDSDGDLARLRAEVTSKGGTTEADCAFSMPRTCVVLSPPPSRRPPNAAARWRRLSVNRQGNRSIHGCAHLHRSNPVVLVSRPVPGSLPHAAGARRLPQRRGQRHRQADQSPHSAAAPRAATDRQTRHGLDRRHPAADRRQDPVAAAHRQRAPAYPDWLALFRHGGHRHLASVGLVLVHRADRAHQFPHTGRIHAGDRAVVVDQRTGVAPDSTPHPVFRERIRPLVPVGRHPDPGSDHSDHHLIAARLLGAPIT